MSDAFFAELCTVVEAEVGRCGVPGLALGLLHEDQPHSASFGVTSIDNPLPVTPDTLFQVGSITKTFTATAAMRLVAAGQLDRDAPVRTYLSDLQLRDADATARLTPRHLLTHTGGWMGDHFADTGRGDDALARYVCELADLEQLTPVGSAYSYCNSGFSLLGRVIEVISGQTYEAALARLVLEPLGLEHTFLFPEAVMTRRFAVGHAGIVEGSPRVLQPWQLPRSATPAGGIISTVGDLLAFAKLHLEDAALAIMREPLVPATGPPDAMVGLTWNVRRGSAWHGGRTHGQNGLLMLLPSYGTALSVLTNAPIGERATGAATDWLLKRLTGFERRPTPSISVPSAVLDDCLGTYESATLDLEVGRLGDALVLREISKGGFPTRDMPPPPNPGGPPMRFGFYAEDRIIGLDPPFQAELAEVVRDADRRVEFVRYKGRLRRRRG